MFGCAPVRESEWCGESESTPRPRAGGEQFHITTSSIMNVQYIMIFIISIENSIYRVRLRMLQCDFVKSVDLALLWRGVKWSPCFHDV